MTDMTDDPVVAEIRSVRSELAERFASGSSARGEMVLVIDRVTIDTESDTESADTNIATRVHALENEGMDNRAALKKVARELGIPRSEAYRRLVAAREQEEP